MNCGKHFLPVVDAASGDLTLKSYLPPLGF